MENKLTKDELQKQLDIIVEKEKELRDLKDNIIFQKYSDMSFFQIWKCTNNWKEQVIGCTLVEILLYLCSDKALFLLMIITPIIYLLLSLSSAIEISCKLKIKKQTK